MTSNIDLRDGLLGCWLDDHIVEGWVPDRSPAANHGVTGIDARWIWFTNPRAVRHVGERERTYIGYLGGPSGTDITVAAFDHEMNTLDRTTIASSFSPDDHTNPSLILREDGYIVVFWTGHNGETIRYRISRRPEDISAFEPAQTISGTMVTYPNPVIVPRSDGDGNEIYLFYRDRTVTRDATEDEYGYIGDGHIYYQRSTDGGETWSEATRLITAPEGHYSMYFVHATDDDGTIHLFITDAERGGDAPKWNVMYCGFRDERCYRAGGRPIAETADGPLTKEDLEVVYDSTVEGNHYAWVWDAGADSDGNPVAVYATFPSTNAHEYRYAKWDDDRWHDHPIADAGGHIEAAGIELHYSAGITVDNEDPSVVYAAIARDDCTTLKRFETTTNGRTWTSRSFSRPSAGTLLRPIVPLNAATDVPVLWLAGSYADMHSSQTVLRGIPSILSEREKMLVGDGERGVDLGLDLLPASAFRNGGSVSALVCTDDPTVSQTAVNFGGAIRLDIARTTSEAFECTVAGADGSAIVSWDDIAPQETHFIEGKWNDERLRLWVDGSPVDAVPFSGPVQFEGQNRGWTLLKDEYLLGSGLHGALSQVRLYGRSLSNAESRVLAERTQ